MNFLYSPSVRSTIFDTDSEILSTKADTSDQQVILECNICFKRFKDRTTLRRHQVIHIIGECRGIDNEEYICKFCDRLYYKLSQYNKHMLENHSHESSESSECSPDQRVVHNCSRCNKNFPDQTTLYSHMLAHSPRALFVGSPLNGGKQESFVCEICSRQFSSKNKYKRHVLVVHSEGKPSPKKLLATVPKKKTTRFTCEFCKFRTRYKSGLMRHIKSHTDVPYQCSLCPKVFSTKEQFIRHNTEHERERKKIKKTVENSVESKSVCLQPKVTLFDQRTVPNSESSSKKLSLPEEPQRAQPTDPQSTANERSVGVTLSDGRRDDDLIRVMEQIFAEPDLLAGKNPDITKRPGSTVEQTRLNADTRQGGPPVLSNQLDSVKNVHTPSAIPTLVNVELRQESKAYLCNVSSRPNSDISDCEMRNVSNGESSNASNRVSETNNVSKLEVHTPSNGEIGDASKGIVSMLDTSTSGTKPYACCVCGRKFYTESTMQQHVKSHQKLPQVHQCELCTYSSANQFAFSRHVLDHYKKKFKCKFCARTFFTQVTKELHEETHDEFDADH